MRCSLLTRVLLTWLLALALPLQGWAALQAMGCAPRGLVPFATSMTASPHKTCPDHAAKESAHSCAACAACVLACALPSGIAPLALEAPAINHPTLPAAPPYHMTQSGPERPPKA